MAQEGNSINQEFFVPMSKKETYQRLSMAIGMGKGGYFDGCTTVTDGSGRYDITRKYVATWTIVLAIVLGLCTLIGFALLLYRKTESCSIMLSDVQGGTKIQAMGVLSQEMYNQVNMTISALQNQ